MKLTCLKPRIATSCATRLTAHLADTPDVQRGTAQQRGYNAKWRKARLAYLRKHPLCVMCAKAGYVVLADVLDHITPHKGNPNLFWDFKNNIQGLCYHHHNSDKAKSDHAEGYR